ncbi:MAG: hypothetical protein ACK5LT_02980 [Lachnospirales bacterium]
MLKSFFILEKYTFFRLIIENYLVNNDYKVVGFGSNSTFELTKIYELKPDYIIINYEIFEKNIFKVIHEIESNIDTQLIIILPSKNKILEKKLNSERILCILNKPFSEMELINILESKEIYL